MAEKKRIIRVMFAKIKPTYHKLSEEEQQEFIGKGTSELKKSFPSCILLCDKH